MNSLFCPCLSRGALVFQETLNLNKIDRKNLATSRIRSSKIFILKFKIKKLEIKGLKYIYHTSPEPLTITLDIALVNPRLTRVFDLTYDNELSVHKDGR